MGVETFMQHQCATSGCFNQRFRMRFADFAAALPGRTSFTDVDAFVEYRGHYVFVEWKHHIQRDVLPARIPSGQLMAYRKLSHDTRGLILCLAVAGDAATSECLWMSDITRGWSGWRPSTSDDLRARIREFFAPVAPTEPGSVAP